MNSLKTHFLENLLTRLMQPGVIGLALAGSFSRGAQDQFSDVDVDVFVESLPDETYSLCILDGKLVSLKYILAADEYDSLTKPEKAIWAVPGLKQLLILRDETGQIAKLKQAAADFNWADLQNAAHEYAVTELMGCAEESQKVISGLLREDESKVLYAAWGIFKSLSHAAAVQAGLMIESENRIFDLMQTHFRKNPAWIRALRLSFGMDVGDAHVPAYQTRGRAALDLYEQTALLFEDVITDEHREVIENTLKLISKFKRGEYA
jgi:predicted nucleotidyltransferase